MYTASDLPAKADQHDAQMNQFLIKKHHLPFNIGINSAHNKWSLILIAMQNCYM